MWARFFTPSGVLVPTSGEALEAGRARAAAAEAENTRLQAELARLRHS